MIDDIMLNTVYLSIWKKFIKEPNHFKGIAFSMKDLISIDLNRILTCRFNEIMDGLRFPSLFFGYTIAITPSSAISRGILFGSLTGGTNNNMAENDTTGTGNVTEYNITADAANTDTTEFWHYAADMDKSGTTPILLIGNVTHESNKTAPDSDSNVNMTNRIDGVIKMTTSWATIGSGNCSAVAAGGNCYIAYWLDIPSSFTSGIYNTTYYYCGNATNGATSCS